MRNAYNEKTLVNKRKTQVPILDKGNFISYNSAMQYYNDFGDELSEGRIVVMAEKKNILTYAGLKKLEDELHDLKVVKRKEVAGKIKEAREQGDLSENAEYDAAKDEQ